VQLLAERGWLFGIGGVEDFAGGVDFVFAVAEVGDGAAAAGADYGCFFGRGGCVAIWCVHENVESVCAAVVVDGLERMLVLTTHWKHFHFISQRNV
jgi:hypothetical protein